MLRFEWSKAVKRPSPVVLRARRRVPRSPWTRFVPRLDPMEDRTLLSTLTVLNNHDSGAGSLRAEITAAMSSDTIVFAPNVHLITLTHELAINKSLDIEGPGANLLTITGNKASRVFDISGAATTTVTIAGLTITDGRADGSTLILPSSGGGILNADNLTLSKVVLTQNVAQGSGTDTSVPQGGGGIFNEAGAHLTLKDSLLTNNQAIAGDKLDVFGGGLLNLGSATVTSCIFSGNKALGGGTNGSTVFSGSQGGAIDNFGGAILKVDYSTFINNQAIGADTPSDAAGANFGVGGAIENNAGFGGSAPSTADIINSIFTGNLATAGTDGSANGGAIDNEGSKATMTLTSSTLTGNQAIGGHGNDSDINNPPGFAVSQGIGGGILNAGLKLTVMNSTLIGNQAIGGKSSTPTDANPATGAARGAGSPMPPLQTLASPT